MKDRLRQLFAATLDDLAIAPRMAAVAARLEPAVQRGEPILVIAFGKAARPMAEALRDRLPDARLRGLVVPPEPDHAPLPPFEVRAGGHPLPTEGSVRAAARALALCRSVATDEHVVYLVSGGGSAMLELPADRGLPITELREFYAALLGSGADITAVNTVRRHFSAVKGGRLALAAAAAKSQLTAAISDVPGNDPAAIASGPSVAEPATAAECEAILGRSGLADRLPRTMLRRLLRGDLPPPLEAHHPVARRSAFVVLLDNAIARARLAHHASAAGMLVVEDQSVDDLPYATAAERLLARLGELHRAHHDRTVGVLTGGELSVPLPAAPGRGGRNQQFALYCALQIQGQPITVLSCGSDGIDGNSPAAGALADGTTVGRAGALGRIARDHLQRCDAFALFDALKDTIVTGPTQQNVRDLRLLVRAV